MTTEDSLRSLVAAYADTLPQMPPDEDGFAYRNLADLVLREGSVFRVSEHTNDLGRGAAGYCFLNARNVVASQSGRLPYTYVEGLVLSPYAGLRHHAWLAPLHEATAVDVTWPWEDNHVGEPLFLGVRVPLAVLQAHWRACGSAAFLADEYHGYPAMRVSYRLWTQALLPLLEAVYETHCLAQVTSGEAMRMADGSIRHREHGGNAKLLFR